MLLLLLSVAVLATVPLAGGRLRALAAVRVQGVGLLLAGVALQTLVLVVLPGDGIPHGPLHLASYGLVAAFLWRNRELPGMALVAAGGALNVAAIAANGGVMPARAEALRTAGLETEAGRFHNSAPIEDARLEWLGDVFAVPAAWPGANVFSLGDVLLLVGLAVAVHRMCGSRGPFAARASLGPLARDRRFVRLWVASGLSQAGDWIHALAVVTVVVQSGGSAKTLALLLVAQVGPAALTGLLGAPLVDRVSRRGLMVGGDLARAVAVGSLLLADAPTIAHFAVVAVVLGVSGAFFQPSIQASLPDIVGEDQLLRANAILATTHNVALTAAPGIGGFIVAQLGAPVAFGLNAISFAVSGILVAACVLPRGVAAVGRAGPLRELREGLAVLRRLPTARAMVVFGGLLMVAAAVKAPAEPLLVLRELVARPEALGFVTAAWGLGMVAGSALSGRLLVALGERRGLSVSIAVAGAAVALAANAPAVGMVVALWLLAGAANGVGIVAFETVLQRSAPERFRGRVIATSEAAMDAGYLLGALTAGWVAASAGPRWALALSGALFGVAAIATVARSYSPRTQARTWSTASST